MIAASVKDSERLVEFLLSKGADPNEKSEARPIPHYTRTGGISIPPADPFFCPQTTPARRSSTSWHPRTTSTSHAGSSRTSHLRRHGFVTGGAR